MASSFRSIVEFFGELGVYDVLLPFLLIFTIVFAVLEKTKIFGMEKIEDVEYTRKNVNAMIAFVIAFFFVASSRLVAVVNEALAQIMLLLVAVIAFLILIGSFSSYKEEMFLTGGLKTGFIAVMLIGVVLIFLNALDWLEPMWDFLVNNWDNEIVGSIVLMLVILLLMWFIVRDKKVKSESSS